MRFCSTRRTREFIYNRWEEFSQSDGSANRWAGLILFAIFILGKLKRAHTPGPLLLVFSQSAFYGSDFSVGRIKLNAFLDRMLNN